ncbi:related to putative arabinase [Cephalotrichum gorgonifer]|uniref:Endo-1,5-alpha-L-arabinanase A n=1 Tax=Cephalotrichum gorgonifer TaxID=2041049 RepID=A0AAE8SYX5_9PEZI|nr:related to putative arabinase [Cephalotrichum gorgonifer]
MKALKLLFLGALARAAQGRLILHYPLTETTAPDSTILDTSGNANDGILLGSPQLTGANGLRLDGVDDHVALPNDLMRDLTSLTASTQVLIRSEQAGNYFIFGLGVTSNGIGNGYVFATGNPFRAAISAGNWELEAESKTAADLPRDVWKTVTYTLDSASGAAALYLDGEKVAGLTNNNKVVAPGTIGGGSTPNNYIGRSQYEADNFLAGSIRDFRIYDTALTEEEIQGLLPDEATRADSALAALSVTNADDIRGNIFLPDAIDGFPLTWASSDPAAVSTTGIVARRDTDVEVTLTATISQGAEPLRRDFTVRVRKAVALAPFEGYAFSYFTGNSREGERIFFAASEGNDALRWSELNSGRPVLTSTLGTTGLRDPFLIRSPEGDTFYLIATDLSIGSGTSWGDAVRKGSRYLEVWESHDLVTWSPQRHVLVSPPEAGMTWAPEAYYDEDLGSYVVFWASALYAASDPSHSGSTYHRMMYATTRDFVSFSEAKVWQDAGTSRIDTTVVRDAETGDYVRFTKDEGAAGTGCTDIIQERSSSLLAPLAGWEVVATCIGRDAGTSAVEGPTVFRANEGDVNGRKYYLFVDEYGGRGYVPLETESLESPRWRVSASYSLPRSPRHGTVIPVTAGELARLRSSLQG